MAKKRSKITPTGWGGSFAASFAAARPSVKGGRVLTKAKSVFRGGVGVCRFSHLRQAAKIQVAKTVGCVVKIANWFFRRPRYGRR